MSALFTPADTAKALSELAKARLLPAGADPDTAATWHAALAKIDQATVADLVNATRTVIADFTGYLTPAVLVGALRAQVRRRLAQDAVPPPPIPLTDSEQATWISAYSSVIKAINGTPEDAWDAAIYAVPRLRPPTQRMDPAERAALIAETRRLIEAKKIDTPARGAQRPLEGTNTPGPYPRVG